MSKLELLNFVVLQWVFIRLARVIETEPDVQTEWCVIGPVLPLSGWLYLYPFRARRLLRWKVRK